VSAVGLKRRARGSSAGSLAGVGSRARARARAETGVETTGTGVETTGTGVETTGTGAEVEAAGGSLAAVSPAAVALGSVLPVGGSMLIPTNEQITASGCSKCPRDRDQLEMRNRSGLGSSLSTVILQRTKEGRLRSRQVDLPFGHLEPR
jgi:hypothetical protein